MPLGDYLIQAPGPSRESLIDVHGSQRLRPGERLHVRRLPAGLGEPSTPSFGDKNAVLAAYQEAVQHVPQRRRVAARRPADGRPRRLRLEQGPAVPGLDDRRRRHPVPAAGHGRRAEPSTATGRPIGALTRVTGRSVSRRPGFPTVGELGARHHRCGDRRVRLQRHPALRPRDVPDRRRARRRLHSRGGASVQPRRSCQFRGQLNTDDAESRERRAAVPAADRDQRHDLGSRADARTAYAGARRARRSRSVSATSTVHDRRRRPVPEPAADPCRHATRSPHRRRRGFAVRRGALVPAGGNVDVDVQLLGLGAATIVVRRPNGQPVVNAAGHARARRPSRRSARRDRPTRAASSASSTSPKVRSASRPKRRSRA